MLINKALFMNKIYIVKRQFINIKFQLNLTNKLHINHLINFCLEYKKKSVF